MNAYTLFLSLILCAAAIQARHYGDRLDTDESDVQVDPIRRAREHGANQIRHRRRSWSNSYGYDYPQPPNPYYPEQKNDCDKNQELLPQILRLLDEISAYVKRPPPPPPPQPIYVPYAVPYPVPQYCSCPSRKPSVRPNVTSRFPDMEDANQNWGFVHTDEDEINDEGDGSRPISFSPIFTKNKGRRDPPKVEHGSSQAGALPSHPANAPSSLGSAPRLPSMCEASALSCCNNGSPAQQQQCFNNAGCGASYDNGNACHRDRLAAIIDAYATAYSPVN